jgi:putative FmdB family regulatory protein
MPTYNIRCTNEECKHEDQVIQKYDDPLPPCELCSSETERFIKQTTFVLKGQGWFDKGGY